MALLLLLLVDGAITNPQRLCPPRRLSRRTCQPDYAEYLRGPGGLAGAAGRHVGYFAQGYGMTHDAGGAGRGRMCLAQPGRGRGCRPLPLFASSLSPSASISRPCAAMTASCCRNGCWPPSISASPPRCWLSRHRLVAARRAGAAGAGRPCWPCTGASPSMRRLLFDPRYDAEPGSAAHVKPGDAIETYGQNCFLPRFPRDARVMRVGQGSLKLRNPLPGVTEVQEAFIAPRNPRFIVLSLAWARRYLRRCEASFGRAHLFPAAAGRFRQHRCAPVFWGPGRRGARLSAGLCRASLAGCGPWSISMTVLTSLSGFSSAYRDRSAHPDRVA